MELIAFTEHIDFILGTGDNFYDPDGVTGVDDPNWNTHWAKIFHLKPSLSYLPWYGVIGNHDYNADGLLSEFKYRMFGWRIDDFFWSQTFTVEEKKLSIVHLDTTYLAYGPDGEDDKPKMRPWFEKLGWTDELMLAKVE